MKTTQTIIEKGGLEPQTKDKYRIDDIVKKGGGDPESEKSIKLATTQANAIQDGEKAYRRGTAAKELGFGKIADVFFRKAKELGINENIKREPLPTFESFSMNEARASAKSLLQSVIKGETKEIEGVKMSKEMAQGYADWLRMSPYGKKFDTLPFHKLFKASFDWGIHRYVDKSLSKELEDLKKVAKTFESMNEAIDPAEYFRNALDEAYGSPSLENALIEAFGIDDEDDAEDYLEEWAIFLELQTGKPVKDRDYDTLFGITDRLNDILKPIQRKSIENILKGHKKNKGARITDGDINAFANDIYDNM